MNGFWLEAAKQVPALAVLVFVVVFFLRFMKDMSAQWVKVLSDIGDDCHEHGKMLTEQTTAALDRNTDELEKTRVMFGEVKEVLHTIGSKQ